MQTKISAKEARDNFTDILGAVYYGNQVIEINKKGRIFAVVINPEEYESLKKAAKGKFFEIVESIRKTNKSKSINRVMKDVTRTVEEVRQERYGRS